MHFLIFEIAAILMVVGAVVFVLTGIPFVICLVYHLGGTILCACGMGSSPADRMEQIRNIWLVFGRFALGSFVLVAVALYIGHLTVPVH